MNGKNMKVVAGWIIGIIILLVTYFVPATELMSHEAIFAVGILVTSVVWMLLKCLPEYAAMLFMCAGWVLTGLVKFETAFNSFAGTSVWIVIAAMTIGVAGAETGLLTRMAYGMMRLFPANFKGQSVGLVVSGTVISPLIPSSAAKASIFPLIAKSISDAMGYKENSKGATGLFAAFFNGYMLIGAGFLSASFISYALVALQPEGERTTWIQWFTWALPWMLVLGILMTFIAFILYKPETDVKLDRKTIAEMYNALGPWTWQQKATLAVLIGTLLFWVTEQMHGISSVITAICAVLVLIAIGIVDRVSFRSKVAWDQVVFIGCFLGISAAFSQLGINDAIRTLLGPVLVPLLSNIWLFIPVLCILVNIARLFIVSITACASLFAVVLMPLAAEAGIHSFVIIFLTYAAAQGVYFLLYQYGNYATARAVTNNTMGSHAEHIKYAAAYFFVNILACYATVPIWKLLGLC